MEEQKSISQNTSAYFIRERCSVKSLYKYFNLNPNEFAIYCRCVELKMDEILVPGDLITIIRFLLLG